MANEGFVEIKYTICLLSPSVALAVGIKAYLTFALSKSGCNLNNWTIPIMNISVQMSMILMTASGLLWLFIGIYLENAIPKAYGSSGGFCFCFCSRKKKFYKKIDKDKIENFETKYMS